MADTYAALRVKEYLAQGRGLNIKKTNRLFRAAMEQLVYVVPAIEMADQAFVEIGCGYGVLACYLAGLFPWQYACLVDAATTEKHKECRKASYDVDCQPWNDVFAACELVKQTGLQDVRPIVAAASIELPPADLIFSMQSWGYHYPIDVYLGPVARAIRPGGRVIVDLRRDTRAMPKILEAGFILDRVLDENGKYERCLFRKPI